VQNSKAETIFVDIYREPSVVICKNNIEKKLFLERSFVDFVLFGDSRDENKYCVLQVTGPNRMRQCKDSIQMRMYACVPAYVYKHIYGYRSFFLENVL
jgi:hypothetical protein